MSTTLSSPNTSDLQADKPVVEMSSVEETNSETSNQIDNANTNDTDSSKNDISPLKRTVSEMSESNTLDQQTPARSTKKTRIDKFKEESEALLKTYGLKDGAASETRLTRSRTRGTPVATPSKQESAKKPATASKRGRKATTNNDENSGSKATPVKKTGGRGRPPARKQEEDKHVDEEKDDIPETATVNSVEADDENMTDGDHKSDDAKELSVEKSDAVETVEESVAEKTETSSPVVAQTESQKEAKLDTSDNEVKTDVNNSTETSSKPTNLNEKSTIAVPSNNNASLSPSSESKIIKSDLNASAKIENNITSSSNDNTNQTEQKNKNIDSVVNDQKQATEEKVIASNDSNNLSASDKQEVSTV